MGQDEAARRIVADLGRFGDIDSAACRSPCGVLRQGGDVGAASPGTWRLGRGRSPWRLTGARPLPFADALTHYAPRGWPRQVREPDKASTDTEALMELVEALRGKDPYWMEQVDIQRQAAEA